MASGDVKLIGQFESFYGLRVRIAFNIKSINYEFIDENVFVHKSDELLKYNPVHKKIPVLVHEGKPICESLIICQYIDEVWSDGPSLLPSDSYDRAQARFWAAFIDDKLFPVMNELSAATKEEEVKTVVSKMLEGLILLEGAFVKCSKGKAFFNGDSIGYLDIALGCGLGWLKVIDRMTDMKLLNETKVPNIVGWAEKFCQDPAVKDVIPGVDRLLEFYKLYLAGK